MLSETNILYIDQQVMDFVKKLFDKNCPPYLLYHNLVHTEYVVKRVREIALYYLVNPIDSFVLTTAAWFHDTGQLFTYGQNHELESIKILKDFIKKKNIDESISDKIEACILATQIPHQPKSLLEEIMCDADTYNLGTSSFLRTDELLKKEFELITHKKPLNWDIETLNFLQSHKYFTSYCQAILDIGKQVNIKLVKSRIA